MRAPQLLPHLAAAGRATFTTAEASELLGGSPIAVTAALGRLRRKGHIVTPRRGFHVTVPPEYRVLGSRPANQFVPDLMRWMERPYYVALLSAAALHGASHQAPQVYQVMTDRVLSDVELGRVRVEFVGRANVADIPIVERNTPTGVLRASTPEATAFDLVGYVDRVGSLDHVATVLGELAESIDAEALADVARHSPLAWARRLGFLLERVGHGDRARGLRPLVDTSTKPTELDPSAPTTGAARSKSWRLVINANVEPDE